MEQRLDADGQTHADLRVLSLKAMESLGVESKQILPHLLKVIDDEMKANPTHNWISDHVSATAVGYLVRLGPPPEAIPVLTRAATQYNHDEGNTPLIARALGRLGPAARSALPALRDAALSDNAPLRRAATEALERINAKE